MLNKSRLLLLLAVSMMIGETLFAVGTLTPSAADVADRGHRYRRYTWVLTSSAGGSVSANGQSVVCGRLTQVRITPASGGTQPSDDYSLRLNDPDGIDLLDGHGATLDNATPLIRNWHPPVLWDCTGSRTIDPVLANAGNAKVVTVVLYVEIQ